VDGIPTGEEAPAGTFFLNEHPIIILFDSGALHDFMSFVCAKKAGLTHVVSGAPYVISLPGGRVIVKLKRFYSSYPGWFLAPISLF
jgi:hypothetical protein